MSNNTPCFEFELLRERDGEREREGERGILLRDFMGPIKSFYVWFKNDREKNNLRGL